MTVGHNDFRVRARKEALAHLSQMLASYTASAHSTLRFDLGWVAKLEADLVSAMKTFIQEAPIEWLSPEHRELTRGIEHESYYELVTKTQERIAKSWPLPGPRGH
jgi:hypothetical protein